MACPQALLNERIWIEKPQYARAEQRYYESLSSKLPQGSGPVAGGHVAATDLPPLGNASSSKVTRSGKKKDKREPHQTAMAEEQPVSAAAASSSSSAKNKKRKNKSAQSTNNDSESSISNQATAVGGGAVGEKGVEKKKDKNKKKPKGEDKGSSAGSALVSEIAKARQHIKDSLERMDGIAALAQTPGTELLERLNTVEKENAQLRGIVDGLQKLVIGLQTRVQSLEGKCGVASTSAPAPAAAAPAPAAKKTDDDDDGVDLFGSSDEEEDAEAAKIREARLAAYAAKKEKKPALIAKSSIILEVKPWDDETDMKEMEKSVRSILMDGLVWGAAKLVPVGYGINKLQICCVIEDDKVSVDLLQEKIQDFEDFVQSVDIAAFNKI